MAIRNATPSDAPFLVKCVLAGLHYYDFESEIPKDRDMFQRLTECEHRGRGIGRALIQDAIQRGTGLGYTKITLLVDPELPHLISLYSSIGFTISGQCHAFDVDFRKMVYST